MSKEYFKVDKKEQLIDCNKTEATELHIREQKNTTGKMLWSVYKRDNVKDKFEHIFTKEY